MYNPLKSGSKGLLLAAVLACCQILIGSATAADRPGDGDKKSIERPRRVEGSVPILSHDAPGSISAASLVWPRKGEIFRGLQLGVEVPAPSLPGEGLFVESSAADPMNMGSGVPGAKTGAPSPSGKPAPPNENPNTVASTVPMTAGEKFHLFLMKSFMPPAPYALSILSGVWDEAIDSKHKKPHRSAGDFAAGSLTHAARSYAFRVTSNFFEKFAYPVAFKQDPRYHRSPYTAFWPRVKYAVTRVLITQGDRNDKHEFNISFLAGGLTAAGISNLWEPTYHQNAADTMSRFGTHVGFRALNNILSEFIGGQ